MELRRFPAAHSIPDIARINLYLTPEARYALVHIRMIHWAPENTDEEQEEVLICQRQLRSAIRHLMKHQTVRLDHLYSEGLHENTDIPAFLTKYVNKRYDDWEDYALARWGIDALLFTEDKLAIRPAESMAITEVAARDRSRLQNEPVLRNKHYNNREDALLKIIHKDQAAIAYAIYGCAHNWRNNIDSWNRAHLDAQFSLMEITPKAVVDFSENRPPPPPVEPFIP